jgi:hypothetical protein
LTIILKSYAFLLLFVAPKVIAGHLIVAARRPLAEGEELNICYVDATAGRAARRKVLKEHYGFDCGCLRCRAEEGFS